LLSGDPQAAVEPLRRNAALGDNCGHHSKLANNALADLTLCVAHARARLADNVSAEP
jgi:hypothetical protein